jgi:hypothetical protein
MLRLVPPSGDLIDDVSIALSVRQRARSRIAPMAALVMPAELEPQRAEIEAIDAEARQMADTIIAELQDGDPDVDVVALLWSRVGRYTRNGLHWLASTNRELALALQTDPRLAAVNHLYTAAEAKVIEARRAGTDTHDRRMLVSAYARLLRSQANDRAAGREWLA